MTEEKVKNRGWIKNVAIIFLAVLLVLTFFSNTIMNRSLPEVAAQYAESGTINARIRGTGTVRANETYEVKVDQSREIHSVLVRTGDTVEVGTPLILLADGDSQELEAAREELEVQQLAYQRALLQNSSADYARELREIEQTREELAEAIAGRDELTVSEEELGSALSALSNANNVAAICQAAVDAAENKLSGVDSGGGGDYSGLYAALLSAQTELGEAGSALETAKLVHGANYETVKAEAVAKMTAEGLTEAEQTGKLAIYMAAVVEQWRIAETYKELVDSYDAIIAAERAAAAAQNNLNSAQRAYNEALASDNSGYYNTLVRELNEAKDDLTAAQNTAARLQSNYDRLKEQHEAWETAAADVETLEDKLADLTFELEEARKADGVTAALAELDLQVLRDDIAELETRIAELETGTAGTTVESRVAGVVSEVHVTAGSSTVPDTALLSIEVTDRGYSTSITVTTEQSKRVTVGDTAEVTGYWGGDVTVTLAAVKPDPNDPARSKQLIFNVTGDVTAGTQMNLSIGQRSASYEVIVPNSAVRSDNNGDFVLMVVAKSSPLGNRYVATRVDVQVLASDDVKTAVSGGLTSSDFVITTSSKPIEPGMLVRMPDNA